MSTTPTTVQDYLAAQPDEVRSVLESVRAAILAAVPGAQEGMRYQMPVVTLDGTYVVHYSAWKHHLGLYPVPLQDPPLEDELAGHRSGKDTVKFLWRDPMPLDLIGRLAAALAEQRARS
jgi:uncharacterized protein YdhG (YjbR/CyaY superfamily)